MKQKLVKMLPNFATWQHRSAS